VSKLARCRPSWKKRTSRKARKRFSETVSLKVRWLVRALSWGVCRKSWESGENLQMEDLEVKMSCVTYDEGHINLNAFSGRKNRGVLYV
jgi:hypothetical protein